MEEGERKGGRRAAWFTADEGEAQFDFWAVYEEHFELIRRKTFEGLQSRHEFGYACSVSLAQARAQHERFLRSWGAPTPNEWRDLEVVLDECREFFGVHGVSINGWCDACMLVEAC